MRILVNAAITLRVIAIFLSSCGCTRACVPELTRLMSAGAVSEFVLHNDGVKLFEADADSEQFCAAVRASSLTHLELFRCGHNPDVAEVAAFINARAAGHAQTTWTMVVSPPPGSLHSLM